MSTAIKNIVLIPGFGTYKNAQWHVSPFDKWFREDGFNVYKYGHKHHGMHNLLTQSQEFIWYLKDNAVDNDSTALVGHSMGGLIAKLSATGKQPIATIGSPLRGTPLAYLAGWCGAGQHMQPGNLFPLSVDDDELNIACRYDLLVPGARAITPGNKNFRVVDHTHISAIFSRKVYELIRDFVVEVA